MDRNRTLSNACSMYGASIGRTSYQAHPKGAHKFNLWRVRLDAGGYDAGGAYWGTGMPLYCAESVEGDVVTFFRAWDRDAAKTQVIENYPNARFFR
jgi:hypothetical protein